MMDDLEILVDQTDFLLSQHYAIKQECMDLFDQLRHSLEEKLGTMHGEIDEENQEKIRSMASLVVAAQDKYLEGADADIEYLEAQRKLMSEAVTETDAARRNAHVAFFLDGAELMETEEFKKMILEEAHDAVDSFSAVVDDMQAALAEEKYDELALYAEDMMAQISGEHDEDEDEDEDDEFEDDEDLDEELGEHEDPAEFLAHLQSLMADSKKNEAGCCGGKSSCQTKGSCSGQCGCDD